VPLGAAQQECLRQAAKLFMPLHGLEGGSVKLDPVSLVLGLIVGYAAFTFMLGLPGATALRRIVLRMAGLLRRTGRS